MKQIIFAVAFLISTTSLPSFGQVGHDLKDAGTDVKDATVTGAKKTAHGTKKAYKKTKSGVQKGAAKVAGKSTTDTSK